MKRTHLVAVLAALLAPIALAGSQPAGKKKAPVISSVIEGRDGSAQSAVVFLLGKGVSKFKSFDLEDADTTPAGTPVLLFKSKTLIALGLPADLPNGAYDLILRYGKAEEMVQRVELANGGVLPQWIGTGPDQVAAGDHDHAADYSTLGHVHDGSYSPTGHDHDADYSGLAHLHDSEYVHKTGDLMSGPLLVETSELSAVAALTNRDGGVGVLGEVETRASSPPNGGTAYGVKGTTDNYGGAGVFGNSSHSAGLGVLGTCQKGKGTGVKGLFSGSGGTGVLARLSYSVPIGLPPLAGPGAPLVADYDTTNVDDSTADIARFQFSGANVARIDGVGRGYFDGGTQTGGADFAESVRVDRPKSEFEPGDVISIDPSAARRFSLCAESSSPLVAGIYSTRPGVLARPGSVAGEQEWREQEIPLAITGIVPCKVCDEGGAIRPGDLLVSATRPGHARKAPEDVAPGTLLGKALESLDETTGKIEVLITMR